jgi:hypothetical protein
MEENPVILLTVFCLLKRDLVKLKLSSTALLGSGTDHSAPSAGIFLSYIGEDKQEGAQTVEGRLTQGIAVLLLITFVAPAWASVRAAPSLSPPAPEVTFMTT